MGVSDVDMDAFVVSEEEQGLRIDKLMAMRYPALSRSYFQNLIENHLILVNGQPVKKRVEPKAGDEVEVQFFFTAEVSVDPENIPLSVLYEDDDILVIDKPSGLVVHPGAGNWTGTFVNALLYHCQELEIRDGTHRPGIVHRLDKETSGVLIAAKNIAAQRALVEQFALRQVEKQYLAICIGNPASRRIDAPIGRHPLERKKMTILTSGGKEAVTDIEALAHNGTLSLVLAKPRTGRTHQIRIHLKSIGHPILGDTLYGSATTNKRYGNPRLLLHAHKLMLQHPMTGKLLAFEAPIPDDIQTWIERIEKCA